VVHRGGRHVGHAHQFDFQIIAGVIGGNAVGAGMKEASLGTASNTIAGALGGLGGGRLLAAVIPPIASAAAGGGFYIGSIIGQLMSGAAVASSQTRRKHDTIPQPVVDCRLHLAWVTKLNSLNHTGGSATHVSQPPAPNKSADDGRTMRLVREGSESIRTNLVRP
jgi:hypothetical protein